MGDAPSPPPPDAPPGDDDEWWWRFVVSTWDDWDERDRPPADEGTTA